MKRPDILNAFFPFALLVESRWKVKYLYILKSWVLQDVTVLLEVKRGVKTRKSQEVSFSVASIFRPHFILKYFAMRWQHLTGHWGASRGRGGSEYVCVGGGGSASSQLYGDSRAGR